MPPDPPSWTEWGSWSTCSQSCGGGQKHRERTCNSKNTLSPVHDVHTRIVNRPPDCPGNPRDTESCHNQDCPGRDYKVSRHVRKVQFFLTLFKRPLTPPLSFEHHVVNFFEGILTKVRKRLSQQLSTK